MSEQHLPLTEDELARDSHDSYFEAICTIGEQVKAGRPLPELFLPSRREPPDVSKTSRGSGE